MKSFLRATCVAAAILCLCMANARAGVVIGGTRVVFPAKQGDVTVRLSNQGNTPALVEAWIDAGDPSSTPDKSNTPFLITPPLFRMEPGHDQSLRIISTSPNLPADRESLFWLNVLEVPPKPNAEEFAGKNVLQFAVRSRLKLFYRPAELTGDPRKAPSQLSWKVAADTKGLALVVHNPSPFYITIAKLTLKSADAELTGETGMVAPFGDLRLVVQGLNKVPSADTRLDLVTIDDYGAENSAQAIVAK